MFLEISLLSRERERERRKKLNRKIVESFATEVWVGWGIGASPSIY